LRDDEESFNPNKLWVIQGRLEKGRCHCEAAEVLSAHRQGVSNLAGTWHSHSESNHAEAR
ncbi:hypothetical protein, partial [Microvirga aerilata]